MESKLSYAMQNIFSFHMICYSVCFLAIRIKILLCHAKFIFLSFEPKFGMFIVVVIKLIKRRGVTMNFAPIILVRPVGPQWGISWGIMTFAIHRSKEDGLPQDVNIWWFVDPCMSKNS